MGFKTLAGNALFRASVCGAAAYGAKLGSTPEVHTWVTNKLPEFLGIKLPSITIPTIHLPSAHYVLTSFPSLAKVLFAIKMAAIPIALAYPTFAFLNWLKQHNFLPPHAKQVIDDSEVLYCPDKLSEAVNFDYLVRGVLYNMTPMPQAVACSLPAHDKGLLQQANGIGAMQGVAPALHTAMSNDINNLRRGLNNRTTIRVAENSQPGFESLLQQYCPEFSYQRFTFRQAHAELAVVRKLSMIVLAEQADRIDKPCVMVGGSMHQVASFPGVIHNHAPRSSGRDVHRQDFVYSDAVQNFAKAVCCASPMQHCQHAFPNTTLVIPFAAQDIHLRTVVKSMIANNQHDCLVAMHLPVPLLDDRVSTWYDDDLCVRYERRDGKIFMYTPNVASAGYGNDAKAMLSWARSMPSVKGYHVCLEEMRSIGSVYCFHLHVSKGYQEDYMSAFKVGSQDFYVLPILKPDWRRHPDEDTHFVVPKNRFANVVAFASSVPSTKALFENVANKVRGQQSEIKIADRIILPRWELTPDQFGSVITHAIIRSEMLRKDHGIFLNIGMAYLDWWYSNMEGGWGARLRSKVYNTFTLSNWRRTPLFFDRGRQRTLEDLVSFQRGSDGRMEDPYAENGLYRVRHRVNTMCTDFNDLETHQPIVKPPPHAVLEVAPGFDNYSTYFRLCRDKAERDKTGFIGYSYHDYPFSGGRDSRVPPVAGPYLSELRRLNTRGAHLQRLGVAHHIYPLGDAGFWRNHISGTFEHEQDSEDRGEPEGSGADQAEKQPVLMENISGSPTIDPSDDVIPAEEIDSGKPPSHFSGSSSATGFVSVAESDDIRRRKMDWPKTREHAPLLQVHLSNDDFRHQTHAKIDFRGSVSFVNQPGCTKSQENFSDQFASLAEVLAAVNTDPLLQVDAPDQGALELLKTVVGGKARRGDLQFKPLEEVGKAGADADSETSDGLQEHVDRFWEAVEENCARRGHVYRKPSVILDGIPASAKSTLARMFLEGRKGLVVVPTRKLRKEWQLRVPGTITVVTQHSIPPADRYDTLVIDEANTLGKRLIAGWLALARGFRARHILALGDSFQGTPRTEEDARFGLAPLEAPTIRLKNSFSMPLDALKVFLCVNGLTGDYSYTTASKVDRSIVLIDRSEPEPSEFPHQDLYTRSRLHSREIADPHGRPMPSVTQSQGTRAERHYFTSGLIPGRHQWFQHMLAVQSVLFTRHTERLILDLAHSDFSDAFPSVPMEMAPVHNGKSQSKLLMDRPRHPFDLDVMLIQHRDLGDTITKAALPIDFSLAAGDQLITMNTEVDLPVLERKEDVGLITVMSGALEVLLPRVQATSRREYKEETDFFANAAYGLLTIGELGWGAEPTMRSHIPGVFNLADIQMARDRHNDLRNVLLRQLNERKPVHISAQDVADANMMFKLYCRSFMKKEVTAHLNGHFGYEYISSRTQAFIDTWEDPFGFAASCVTRSSFLKTQAKVKPGLNGQETHGQTIIANRPELTNLFGPWARSAYYYMTVTDREDFITDTGFSDRELSQAMILRGIGSRIEASGNLQVDLTRQDSTHRPAHVIAYCMFLEAAGVPEEVAQMYLALRSVMYIKSLAPDLYRAEARWNLASGDPFTLNANCFMMKCNLAVEYDGLEYCAGVQKGDDFISSNEGWRRSARGGMRKRLAYGMKVDVDKPPYHAGRFLHKGHWLADPVRAFFRHFSKPYNPAVTIEELYQSFVDREIHYTEAQSEYLKHVIPLFYPDVNSEEAVHIVDTIANLRSFNNFKSTYKHATQHQDRIFDPEHDCAFQVAQVLAPQLARSTLRQFRNVESEDELIDLFNKFGIRTLRCTHPAFVPHGFVGAVIAHKHVYACLPPRPTGL